MPVGTFALLFDSGREIGQRLVADHRIFCGRSIRQAPAQTMLTAGICEAYASGVAKLGANNKVKSVAAGLEGSASQGSAALGRNRPSAPNMPLLS
jgi:hypothetical protein